MRPDVVELGAPLVAGQLLKFAGADCVLLDLDAHVGMRPLVTSVVGRLAWTAPHDLDTEDIHQAERPVSPPSERTEANGGPLSLWMAFGSSQRSNSSSNTSRTGAVRVLVMSRSSSTNRL